MQKIIPTLLTLGLFLTGCSSSVAQTTSALEIPTASATEVVTEQAPTQTVVPTQAATAALPSTPDLSLINLPTEQEGEIIFDFVEQLCDAEWSTRGQELPCPGSDTQSSVGYIMQIDGATQGLPSNMNILLAYTPQEKYETIYGKYPAVTVQKGDRFRAVLECREHSFCDVEFVLNFSDERGSAGLKNWRYLFTDEPIVVDYPLDALIGQNVQFTLAVRARGNPVEAYAVWISPHIYRPVP